MDLLLLCIVMMVWIRLCCMLMRFCVSVFILFLLLMVMCLVRLFCEIVLKWFSIFESGIEIVWCRLNVQFSVVVIFIMMVLMISIRNVCEWVIVFLQVVLVCLVWLWFNMFMVVDSVMNCGGMMVMIILFVVVVLCLCRVFIRGLMLLWNNVVCLVLMFVVRWVFFVVMGSVLYCFYVFFDLVW